MMQLPSPLIANIRDGKVVLVLGTGAADATDSARPIYDALSHELVNRFLGSEYIDATRDEVAALCLTEQDVVSVQTAVRDFLVNLPFGKGHSGLSQLVWKGLATISVDTAIEDAYRAAKDPKQSVVAFIDNTDRVDDKLRSPGAVQLLKLHGCITRISDKLHPLFLSLDSRQDFPTCRNHVLRTLCDWAREHTLVFVGDQFDDPVFRQLLRDVTRDVPSRPRFYYVRKNCTPVDTRHWESHKITTLDGGLEDFTLLSIDACASLFQGVKATLDLGDHPVFERLITKSTSLSNSLIQFLKVDTEYIKGISATEPVRAKDFYRGQLGGWSAIEQRLDVRRNLTDTVLSQHILGDGLEPSTGPQLILIESHAGAGKSVFLRRLAWDAANEYDRLCLFVKDFGRISGPALQELCEVTAERVFIFVDDAQRRIPEIIAALAGMDSDKASVTIVAATRQNEWNMFGSDAESHISERYPLRYLSETEINRLLVKLEEHGSLGELAKIPARERKTKLVEQAGRQLLVALHEATLDRRFPDIVYDEYLNVRPDLARQIYLTICVFNRLGIPVRAGIVSRVHGVNFADFKRDFFSPLEGIVRANEDPVSRDMMYRARHPEIAQMVFDRALTNQETRFDEYIRCLKSMNLSYMVDNEAFSQMVRAYSLMELFSNAEMIDQIYEAAIEVGGDEGHLFHQRGIYEMRRPSPDFDRAEQYLERAQALRPHNDSIKHTIAELWLGKSEVARTSLEREHRLSTAAAIAKTLCRRSSTSHPHATLVKIGISRLRTALSEPSTAERDLQVLIQTCEDAINAAFMSFPESQPLYKLEAEFSKLIEDEPRSLKALENAFEINPRNAAVARRLARAFSAAGFNDKATDCLRKALDAKSGDRQLHLAYAQALQKEVQPSSEAILFHLSRAYLVGDKNYKAQILHIRELYVQNEFNEVRSLIAKLEKQTSPFWARREPSFPLQHEFHGTVRKVQATYFFVERDGSGDLVYVHRTNVDVEDSVWRSFLSGTRVRLRVGFTLRGASACQVCPE